MYRFAIAAVFTALAILLVGLLIGRIVRYFNTQANQPVGFDGGVMPKIAFFLLLCVMVYAISTGAT